MDEKSLKVGDVVYEVGAHALFELTFEGMQGDLYKFKCESPFLTYRYSSYIDVRSFFIDRVDALMARKKLLYKNIDVLEDQKVCIQNTIYEIDEELDAE